MAKKKVSWLPKFEVLIILVFFMSFIVWAVSQCNETKALYQEDEPETTSEDASIESTNIPDSLTTSLTNTTLPNNTTTTPQNTPPPPATTARPLNNFAPLFVTIDGLNMRTGPSLDSGIVVKLKLFEQVNFMGEVTDSTEQINLGYETADEPWVKVQHKRGKVGWVYGAGVNYYKKKRGGVIN